MISFSSGKALYSNVVIDKSIKSKVAADFAS